MYECNNNKSYIVGARGSRSTPLWCSNLRPLAPHAAGEGLELAAQIKSPDDLAQLLERVAGTQAVTAQDSLAFEQAAVAGQENAMLTDSLVGEEIIGDVVLAGSIEAKHTQISSQAAEVAVEDETGVAHGLGKQADGAADFDGFEEGIYRDTVAILGDGLKINRPAIDDDQIDLGMGHAERFGQVLDGLAAFKGEENVSKAQARGQKVVQLSVKAEGGGFDLVLHGFALWLV